MAKSDKTLAINANRKLRKEQNMSVFKLLRVRYGITKTLFRQDIALVREHHINPDISQREAMAIRGYHI